MTTLLLNQPNHLFTRLVNTGSSEESRNLERRMQEILLHFRRRAERDQGFLGLAQAIERAESTKQNEMERITIDQRAKTLACRFMNALSTSIPTPEVAIDPDGEISFDWIVSKDRQFSVSLAPDGLLSYAGVFGNNISAHGTEEFDDTIPETIVDAIRRLGFK